MTRRKRYSFNSASFHENKRSAYIVWVFVRNGFGLDDVMNKCCLKAYGTDKRNSLVFYSSLITRFETGITSAKLAYAFIN